MSLGGLSIRGRILAAIWTVTAVISLAFSYTLYDTQKNEYLAGIDSKLVAGATMARAIMGAGYHDNLVDASSVSPDAYLKVISRYNELCRENGFQYLWSNLFLEDGSIVFTSSTSTSKDVAKGDHALFFDAHSDPAAFAPVLKSGKTTFSTFHNEWGAGRMVLIPFQDVRGRTYVFGASISIDELTARLNETLLHSVFLFLVAFGIGTVVSLLMARAITDPLRRVKEVAKGIAAGNYGLHAQVDSGGDDLESLATSINTMSDAIDTQNSSLETLVEERTRELNQKVRELDFQKASLDAHAIVSISDVDGNITYANDKFCKVSGYSREELLGQNHRILKSDEHSPAYYRNLWETIERGDIWSGFFKNRKKDGTFYWVDATIVPFTDEAGKPFQYVAIRTDITRQVLNEIALQESEQKYRTIFETSKVGLALCELDGTLLECNQAYLDMIGYTIEEARKLSYWDLTPKKYQEQEYDQLRALREKGFYGPYEKHYVRKDGSQIPVLLNGTLLKTPDGKERIWSIVQDISIQKDAEKRLSKALQRAEKSDRAKSEFLSAMSHELRTPLNAILGFSQLLKADTENPLTGEQVEEVDHIYRSGNHLLELINEVLDLSKIEAGKYTLNTTDVLLSPLLDECISLIQASARSRNISISISCVEPSGVVLRADEVRLKQVILNLLSNAVKYNIDCGSIKIVCHVSDSGTARLEFHDTGTGIPEDKRDSIFEPFSRGGSTTSEIEGTGIGLTITRKLVELMDGHIGFDSKPGMGSTFWIEMPLSAASATTSTQLMSTGRPAIPTDARNTLRVLYVEDDSMNVALMKRFLKRHGETDLLIAHTAELGISMAEEKHPDIILMDINLPGIDGNMATRRLKENLKTASIPVIMITANAMENDIQNGLSAGADAYLTKPLNLSDFLKTLDQVLTGAETTPAS